MARNCRLRDETIGLDVVLLLLDNGAVLDAGDDEVLVVVDTAAGLFDDVLSIEYIGDYDFVVVGSEWNRNDENKLDFSAFDARLTRLRFFRTTVVPPLDDDNSFFTVVVLLDVVVVAGVDDLRKIEKINKTNQSTLFQSTYF